LLAGRSVAQIALVERLDRLGYERVSRRPEHPGHYFYGHEVFWIYRRFHRAHGRNHRAVLIGLRLRRDDGMIVGGLAAEDARFFEHGGLDTRSLARAALANVRAGEVVQGGSTITQQLIKNRDLSPRRTVGRKLSEAARALALEANYDKREILEAYLNQVYLGHVDGLALHGVGTAARAYFSSRASELTLAEAATLAAMIQGPNRLSPSRHRERVAARRDWVLSRMEQLGWAEASAIRAARRGRLELRPTPPTAGAPRQFLAWISDLARRSASERMDQGRGIVAETTLDPWLQQLAEREVRTRLRQLRRDHPRLRGSDLSAVLVALDPDSGAVLAYVGGDPERRDDRFDRGRLGAVEPRRPLPRDHRRARGVGRLPQRPLRQDRPLVRARSHGAPDRTHRTGAPGGSPSVLRPRLGRDHAARSRVGLHRAGHAGKTVRGPAVAAHRETGRLDDRVVQSEENEGRASRDGLPRPRRTGRRCYPRDGAGGGHRRRGRRGQDGYHA
jgi:hypothetical protein